MVELLVSMAVLIVTIVAVVEVFNISSETTSRTTAHAEVIAASAALQQRLTNLLSKIEPGMLIIDCPNPTGGAILRADVPDGPQSFRLRHDRLVFVASGGPGEFQSFTDPRRGTPDDPTIAPASSPEALIYFGPGIPLSDTGDPRVALPYDNDAYRLPGSRWILAHRAILLLADAPNPAVPDWIPEDMSVFTGSGGMFHGGRLGTDPAPSMLRSFGTASMDAIVSSSADRADASTLVRLFTELPIGNLLTANSDARALWDANWCPTTVSLEDPAVSDYGDHYVRTGFTLQPRLADFRIEWTDGRRIDTDDSDGSVNYGTRWFGLGVDPASLATPESLQYTAVMRQDFPSDTTTTEAEAFGVGGGNNRIEWASSPGGSSTADNAYRAVWRLDTWPFRPTALRFSYRIYDTGRRLKRQTTNWADEFGDTDPPVGSPPVVYTRFGQAFSIVIPLR